MNPTRLRLPFLTRSTALMTPLLFLLAACGDNLGAPPMTPDASVPLTCADVQCDGNATCDAASGDAVCTCNAGYEGDGASCSDIDECDAAQSPCHLYASCENTGGSFTCTCNDGATGDGFECSYPASCDELVADPNPASGVYTIDPDGDGAVAAFDVYCDMDTAGEGWTLAFVKNSVDVESYGDFGAAYEDLAHLQVHPNAASQDAVARSGWVALNAFPYTRLRITAHAAGAESFRSEPIDRAELRIAFGEDGYYLYGSINGYYWCGGASSFTDGGQGQVNQPVGATNDCKGHGTLGDGWDFSMTNTAVNLGLTVCGGEMSGGFMHGGFASSAIFYPNSGAAQAIWVR
jgi:hypothetical protein